MTYLLNLNVYLLCFVLLYQIIAGSNDYTFEDYIVIFEKNYTDDQKIFRKSVYQARIAKFSEINACEPGVNNLTDWTEEQINRLRGLKVDDQAILIDIQENNDNIISTSSNLNEVPPTHLDWRESHSVTSVKTQGDCASYYAFSAVGYLQSKLIIQKKLKNNIDLSQQYLAFCTPNSNCRIGGYPADALNYAKNHGVAYQASFPYNYNAIDPEMCMSNNTVQVNLPVLTKNNLTDDDLINLLQSGPISIWISATAWEYYKQGIFTCEPNALINHIVLLIGYTQNYWIIKNQWGKLWGDNGFMRVTRSRTRTYSNCFIGYQVDYMAPFPTNYENILKFGFGFIFLIIIILK